MLNKSLKQKQVGLEYLAMIGAAAGMNRIVGLRQTGRHELEMLSSFINHKVPLVRLMIAASWSRSIPITASDSAEFPSPPRALVPSSLARKPA